MYYSPTGKCKGTIGSLCHHCLSSVCLQFCPLYFSHFYSKWFKVYQSCLSFSIQVQVMTLVQVDQFLQELCLWNLLLLEWFMYCTSNTYSILVNPPVPPTWRWVRPGRWSQARHFYRDWGTPRSAWPPWNVSVCIYWWTPPSLDTCTGRQTSWCPARSGGVTCYHIVKVIVSTILFPVFMQ